MSGPGRAGAPSRVGASYRQCPGSCATEKPRVQSLDQGKALLLQMVLIKMGTSRNGVQWMLHGPPPNPALLAKTSLKPGRTTRADFRYCVG